MSADNNDTPKNPNQPNTEKTGYCLPPRHGQFSPGKSGNPAGRPRRKKLIGGPSVLASAMLVSILDGGARRRVTVYEATLLKLVGKALKGNRKAQAEVFKTKVKYGRLATEAEPADSPGHLVVTVTTHDSRQPPPQGKKARPRKPRLKKKPAGPETHRQIFMRVLARRIELTEGGRKKRVSIDEALWRSIFADALKGDIKAIGLVGRFLETPAAPARISDIIDENGVMTVTVNIGKPPGRDSDDEEEDPSQAEDQDREYGD